MLFEELKRADLILEELKDDDLSFSTCEVLIEKEQSLKLDIIDMKKIRELQEVIRFLPKLDLTYTSLDDATKVIEEVRFSTIKFFRYYIYKFSEYFHFRHKNKDNSNKMISDFYFKGSELVGLEFNRSFLSRFKGQ